MPYTLHAPVHSELIIKKSRFIGCVQPMADRAGAQAVVDALWRQHPGAAHVCWALLAGGQSAAVDDGEPGGTAGRPMLDVLRHQDLEGVLATVVRYFGGVKLGAGGLVRAYTNSVAQAVAFVGVAQRVPVGNYTFQTGSAAAGKLLNVLHTCPFFTVTDVAYGERVTFTLQFPVDDLPHVRAWIINHLQREVQLERQSIIIKDVPVTEEV